LIERRPGIFPGLLFFGDQFRRGHADMVDGDHLIFFRSGAYEGPLGQVIASVESPAGA
jgi:hypothetical protein